MIIVPLQAVPNQTLSIVLATQLANISVRQNGANIYFTLALGTQPIVTTRICRDRQQLLLDAAYQGFVGDFEFQDTQGTDDPFYTGLGARWQLVYLEASDLAALAAAS